MTIRTAAQHLATVGPAGVRKRQGAWPARMRENGWGVAGAAGQLSARPLGTCRITYVDRREER